MAVIQMDLTYNKMKDLGLDNLINDEKLIKAISSNNKDDLRDLIIETVEYLQDKYSVKFKELYYSTYYPLGNELFDMFSCSCIEEIFNLFGYTTETVECKDLDKDIIEKLNIEPIIVESCLVDETNHELWVGAIKIYNENLEIYIYTEENMHNKLISLFVDTKRAIYKTKE